MTLQSPFFSRLRRDFPFKEGPFRELIPRQFLKKLTGSSYAVLGGCQGGFLAGNEQYVFSTSRRIRIFEKRLRIRGDTCILVKGAKKSRPKIWRAVVSPNASPQASGKKKDDDLDILPFKKIQVYIFLDKMYTRNFPEKIKSTSIQ